MIVNYNKEILILEDRGVLEAIEQRRVTNAVDFHYVLELLMSPTWLIFIMFWICSSHQCG